jgi:hypothetical protein
MVSTWSKKEITNKCYGVAIQKCSVTERNGDRTKRQTEERQERTKKKITWTERKVVLDTFVIVNINGNNCHSQYFIRKVGARLGKSLF